VEDDRHSDKKQKKKRNRKEMSIKEDESSSKQDVNDPNDESAARDISIYKFTTTKKSQPKLEMMKDPDGFWGKSLDWV